MNKNLNLFFFLCTVTAYVHAQWSQKDSLNLRRILEGDGEIQINPNAVKQIDFGSFVGKPLMSTDKPGLQYDTRLPNVFPEKAKIIISLQIYNINTKFNYDPVYRKDIKVEAETWRSDTIRKQVYLRQYSNWASSPLEGGVRKSLEEIEATGLRYNPIGGRANNMAVGVWESTPSKPSGMDFGKFFTKEFWSKKKRKRKAKTLELLHNYNDPLINAKKKR